MRQRAGPALSHATTLASGYNSGISNFRKFQVFTNPEIPEMDFVITNSGCVTGEPAHLGRLLRYPPAAQAYT